MTKVRTSADRCPGVFTTHEARDGALARIRLPGGRIRADQLGVLAQASAAHADGFLELTARGNIQLRGIADVEAVAEAVVSAGLAPDSAHDKARNIEVSPLTGRIGGAADAGPLLKALDDALRSHPDAEAVSGRFLFGVDDGRGDIVRRRPDACAVLQPGEPLLADIVVDGTPIGSVSGTEGIVASLISVATGLQDIAPGAWRVRDLGDEDRARLHRELADRHDPVVGERPGDDDEDAAPVVGWFDQDDGSVLLGCVVELGRLPARLAEFLAAVDKPIVFTPDREILICDLSEGVAETVVRVLAPMGLIFDASSPWARLSCCVGAPGCGSAHTRVRDDLLAHVRAGSPVADREHWVGCERRCGSPGTAHLLVQATPDGGYERRRR
ncbi:nitrite/sulfite reductase [Gordonia paraffinivorans]|uniref:nitrite/sulfite reductase n=1 Tax=Gordonia paraffinivorans TaxID=175628 RepID=UPI001445CACE|nr:nitrite/sulfite reductase [Gordonia paraffinivorans]